MNRSLPSLVLALVAVAGAALLGLGLAELTAPPAQVSRAEFHSKAPSSEPAKAGGQGQLHGSSGNSSGRPRPARAGLG